MMKEIFKKIVWVFSLALLLLGVPRFSGMIADLFDYSTIDTHGSFAWISVHHIVQALIFIIIIFIIKRYKSFDFGSGWGDKERGKSYVLKFLIIFGIGSIVSHLLAISIGSFQPFGYPLTPTNIIGQLGFQLFLSGPSEELIFRAFAITMLVFVLKGRFLKWNVSSANIIAAVIFGLAHVGFSFVPFELRYDLFQVIMAFVLGLFYGDCYEKTNSMYYPMIMHSMSNVIMVGITIIATFIL